jgi:hypothetical protein
MRTVGTDGWFVIFRLYGPLEPFFDKTFSLPDFEVVDLMLEGERLYTKSKTAK